MLRNTKVLISQNIKASFTPLMYIFGVFGIFPMKIQRNMFGILYIKWSLGFSFYSYLFAALMISLCMYSSINQRVMEVIKLDGQSVIDKIVTMFPTVGYCTGAFFGVFYVGSKVTQLLKYFKIINQVDFNIKTEYSSLDKYKSLIVPIITFINSEMIHCLYILIYKTLVGNKLEVAKTMLIKHTPHLMTIYISLFVAYLIRLMTYNLELRFIRLNNILRDNYLAIKNKEEVVPNKPLIVVEMPEDGDEVLAPKPPENEDSYLSAEEILGYNKAYLKLIQAAGIINDLAGLNILVIMVSTFVDLVSTLYFIILILKGKPQGELELFTILTIFTFDLLRVLVITEPFYHCIGTIKDTSTQICKLLCLNIGQTLRRQVKIFAVCIYLTETEFNACGLFTVDRFMIATLIGGITNYVAILLGFKEDSG